jgi:hypothetical protein
MTYQERQRYRQLRDEVEALRDRLEAGDPDEPLTRGEALEILALVDAAVERMSPERWDRALDAVAREAARRAGSHSGFGGG